jgi:hypothetical protein
MKCEIPRLKLFLPPLSLLSPVQLQQVAFHKADLAPVDSFEELQVGLGI